MKKDKRITYTNPPYTKLQKSLYKFSDEVPWKDVIPTLLNWIKEAQPKDKETAYNIEFWLKEYGYTRKT